MNKSKYKEAFFSWTTISEIKNFIKQKNGFAKDKQRQFLKQQELILNSTTIEDLLDDENETKMVLNLLSQTDNSKHDKGTLQVINDELEAKIPEKMKRVILNIKHGFEKGFIPKAIEEGVSGNYFLNDQYKNNVAIFKPFDEEAFAPNNPKGFVGRLGFDKGFRDGVQSGESATREVAAYLLDDQGLHKVPETSFIQVNHSYYANRSTRDVCLKSDLDNKKQNFKLGSLQVLKKNDGEIGDFSCSLFSTYECQAIAILDLRILNCDRNEGNILVRIRKNSKGQKVHSLVPIDHGLAFPDNLNIAEYEIAWSLWPQIKKPIHEKLKEYILNLDTIKNLEMLQSTLKFRPICQRNYRIAETLLIEAVKMDFTLYDISKIMYKKDRDEGTSILQEIVKQTETYYKKLRNKELYIHLNDQNIIEQRKRLKSGDSIEVSGRKPNKMSSSSCESTDSNKIKCLNKVLSQKVNLSNELLIEDLEWDDLQGFNRRKILSQDDIDSPNTPTKMLVSQTLNKIKSCNKSWKEGVNIEEYLFENKEVIQEKTGQEILDSTQCSTTNMNSTSYQLKIFPIIDRELCTIEDKDKLQISQVSSHFKKSERKVKEKDSNEYQKSPTLIDSNKKQFPSLKRTLSNPEFNYETTKELDQNIETKDKDLQLEKSISQTIGVLSKTGEYTELFFYFFEFFQKRRLNKIKLTKA